MNVAQNIANSLKELRAEEKKKQSEIAKILNISSSTYSNYERGANIPDFTVLIKVAEHYNVSVEYILGLTRIRTMGSGLIETKNGKISVKDISSLNDENREVIRIMVEALKMKEKFENQR